MSSTHIFGELKTSQCDEVSAATAWPLSQCRHHLGHHTDSGKYFSYAAAFGPTRGFAVRAQLNLRPDGTDVPIDDNPFLHPKRYVEALLFQPAAKKSEVTSLRPATSWSSPGAAKPAEPAPVSTFAGGDSWSAPVPTQVAPATVRTPLPPAGGDYLSVLGGEAPVKKAPARGKLKVATKTMGGYLDNMSSASPAPSLSAPAPSHVTSATIRTPLPPAGGDYLSAVGCGAPVKKTPARGKPKVATTTMGCYLDNVRSGTSASSWSAPAPSHVAPATVRTPLPPAGGDYLSILSARLSTLFYVGMSRTREPVSGLSSRPSVPPE
jgi:hypothetical protein